MMRVMPYADIGTSKYWLSLSPISDGTVMAIAIVVVALMTILAVASGPLGICNVAAIYSCPSFSAQPKTFKTLIPKCLH